MMNLPRPQLCVLVVVVTLAGCTGGATSPEADATSVEEPSTTTDATERPETTASPTMTTGEYSDTPETGDTFLSVVGLNESVVTNRTDESLRARFAALTPARQDAFLEALRCDCRTEQTAFEMDDDRPTVVRYEGQWYGLRLVHFE